MTDKCDHTVLLRLRASLQAWSTNSMGCIRPTAHEPTKSGVLGIICHALGQGGDATVQLLGQYRFGTRTDRKGDLYQDFKVALDVPYASARYGSENKPVEIAVCTYLADASFVAGLQCTRDWAERIYQALLDPIGPLYLGRKCCIPDVPLFSAGPPRPLPLIEALQSVPLDVRCESNVVTLSVDSGNGIPDTAAGYISMDTPLSYPQKLYAPRKWYSWPTAIQGDT